MCVYVHVCTHVLDLVDYCSTNIHVYTRLWLQIIACHVDYGNRPESAAEAEFVEKWCAKYGIVFRQRRIEEVWNARPTLVMNSWGW